MSISNTTINDLPQELLIGIISHLDFEDVFPRLSLLSKRWQAATQCSKSIRVRATSNVRRIGLQTIVDAFPLLERLRLEACLESMAPTLSALAAAGITDAVINPCTSALIHEVAHQFHGHPRLTRIESDSDCIVHGALRCPRLTALVLSTDPGTYTRVDDGQDMLLDLSLEGVETDGSDPDTAISQEDVDDGATNDAVVSHPATNGTRLESRRLHSTVTLGPRGRRNIGMLLRAMPQLQHLDIDAPSFWRREAVLSASNSSDSSLVSTSRCSSDKDTQKTISQLRSLRITSINSWAMANLVNWLDHPRIPENFPTRLPHLTSLYIDIDYLHLPTHTIRAIASGCPRLESLKFKFAMMPREALLDVVTHLKSLKRLEISKSDMWFVSQSWAHVSVFLASGLPRLEYLSLSNCTVHAVDDTQWHATYMETACALTGSHDGHGRGIGGSVHDCTWPTGPFSAVRGLKIIDTGESRPDAAALHTIVTAFPQLKSLRMDLSASCFPVLDTRFLSALRTGLSGIETLELRLGRVGTRGDSEKQGLLNNTGDDTMHEQAIHMPHLKSLSLWCFDAFPHFLIVPNTATIERLSINYMATVREWYTEGHQNSIDRWCASYSFPHLRQLEIRGLSNIAHTICLDALMLFTQASHRLESLSLDAVTKLRAPMPMKELQRLSHSCPNLRSLRISNFVLPKGTLGKFVTAWPDLTRLDLVGSSSLGAITRDWETTQLEPFMHAHRQLKHLALGVSDLCLDDGFELMRASDIMTRLTTRGSLVPEDFGEGFERTVQTANANMYRRYGAQLRLRFRWLRECSISGPLEPVR